MCLESIKLYEQVYLEELHCLPAVPETFYVQLKGGIISLFNKTKRHENVMSVAMVKKF